MSDNFERQKQENTSKKTEIKSYDSWNSKVHFAVSFVLIILSERLYRQPLLDFTISPDGIPWLQGATGPKEKYLWSLLTFIGAGREILFATFVIFIFGKRSKSLYYILMIGTQKMIKEYLKLAIANPRPYMVSDNIHPYLCPTSFGNPSGHSMAASLASTAMFLDIFHGDNQRIFKWPTYIFGLSFALFWTYSMPYAVLLMGVHSLNQVIFGHSLGIWSGLFLHFIVRDKFLKHIEDVTVPQVSDSSSECLLVSPADLEISTDDVESEQSKCLDGRSGIIISSLLYMCYGILTLLTFQVIDHEYPQDSPQVKSWTANFKKGGCGTLVFSESFYHDCLQGCAQVTLPYFLYVFTIYRNELLKCFSSNQQIKIQDSSIVGGISLYFFRFLVFLSIYYFSDLAKMSYEYTMQNTICFVIFPMTTFSYLLVGGPYDLILNKLGF